MGKRDKRIDKYIASAAEFAQPIMKSLREQVHATCPDAEETLKWGHPSFMYHGLLCSFAAFKEHATFGFWKGSIILAGKPEAVATSMGHFGRLTSTRQLPAKKVLAGYIKEAMRLNAEGIKAPNKNPRKPKPPVKTPPDFAAALKKSKQAAAHYQAFTPSHQREYVEWITEAKRPETRAKRLVQAVEWIAEGKARNWKYMDC